MVSADSSTALTCTPSDSRVPSSSSTTPLGSSSSRCLKDSSWRLLCTSLRSISVRPPPLPVASVTVLCPLSFVAGYNARSIGHGRESTYHANALCFQTSSVELLRKPSTRSSQNNPSRNCLEKREG